MKKRLDIVITERGLRESRQQAQTAIMSGYVFVNGQRAVKAGMPVAEDAVIEIRDDTPRYVSRGGFKLEKALHTFPLALNGSVCADIGASTGGFTDCMLQHGAAKVYAVDVGYGQFAWKLRQDSRVICLERTNARYLSREQIPEPLDFASVDVSFISLRLILPPLRMLLHNGARAVCLIKPQFEAGRDKVGKKGVVRDSSVHLEVLEQFLNHAREADFRVCALTWSPVRGPEGNIEYLGYLRPGTESAPDDMPEHAPENSPGNAPGDSPGKVPENGLGNTLKDSPGNTREKIFYDTPPFRNLAALVEQSHEIPVQKGGFP